MTNRTLPDAALRNVCTEISRGPVFILAAGEVQVRGTRAMLEDLGVLPFDPWFPASGWAFFRWEDGLYRYRMGRRRPDGVKGPRVKYKDVDWWCVAWRLIDERMGGERPDETLHPASAWRSSSPEGQAVWRMHWERYCAAMVDREFGKFCASIPVLAQHGESARFLLSRRAYGVRHD